MFALLLTFDDDPARLEGRPAHRDRLAALRAQGKILAAGPWADESGALLVFRVEGRDELDQIVAADPYYSGPGVTGLEIREWNAATLAAELG